MWRKRRRPTPHYKVPPPYNPLHGEQANLRQEGVSPFCAMVQVAAEDTHENYVVCRGFDPRILKFIDYAEGDASKPGISVAKPFGKRRTGTYEIGEIYPALLPTQGNADFMDFRQVTFIPPSPVGVNWRLGQNPGVVQGGGLDGGQPENLSGTIEILYDDSGKVINWLLIDSDGGDKHYLFTLLENMGDDSALAEIRTMDDATQVEESADVVNTLGDFSHLVDEDRGICVKVDGVYYAVHPEGREAGTTIEYTIDGLAISDEPDYLGLKEATVTVRGGEPSLINTQVLVYDHSGCIFDLDDMVGFTGWAHWAPYATLDPEKACDAITPYHWAAINRCCDPDSGTYRDCEGY